MPHRDMIHGNFDLAYQVANDEAFANLFEQMVAAVANDKLDGREVVIQCPHLCGV